MRRFFSTALVFLLTIPLFGADKPPLWVTDKNKAFPDKDWVSVVHSAKTKESALNAAYSSLAAAFRVDIKSLVSTNEAFAAVSRESGGKKTTGFTQTESLDSSVTATSDASGLVGVETDTWTAGDGKVWANARMNRKECILRYASMIKENTAMIEALKKEADGKPATFDAFAALDAALAIAAASDNYQAILEVLDSTASERKPAYGGAEAVRRLRDQCARSITVSLNVDLHGEREALGVTRAFGSFFKDLGFKTSESGKGDYTLNAALRTERTETSASGPKSFRYYLNASIADSEGKTVFAFEDTGRQNHKNAKEAEMRALRAAENVITKGRFAAEFKAFLYSGPLSG